MGDPKPTCDLVSEGCHDDFPKEIDGKLDIDVKSEARGDADSPYGETNHLTFSVPDQNIIVNISKFYCVDGTIPWWVRSDDKCMYMFDAILVPGELDLEAGQATYKVTGR